MGYTHYYYQYRDLTHDEWTEFTDQVRQILNTDVPLAGWDGKGLPVVDDNKVSFNGVEGEGCETCYFQRDLWSASRDQRISWNKKANGPQFEFCKTRRRPYDPIVVAVYEAAKAVAPDAFDLSSDGGVFNEEEEY